jgi:hypothetical protein
MKDPYKTKEWRIVQKAAREDLVPRMLLSENVIMLQPDNSVDFDVAFAVEIGASIMLDKPLILIVDRGRTPYPRLARIADKVINVDMSTEEGREAAHKAVSQYLDQ